MLYDFHCLLVHVLFYFPRVDSSTSLAFFLARDDLPTIIQCLRMRLTGSMAVRRNKLLALLFLCGFLLYYIGFVSTHILPIAVIVFLLIVIITTNIAPLFLHLLNVVLDAALGLVVDKGHSVVVFRI